MTSEPTVTPDLDPMDTAMATEFNPTYTVFGQCEVDVYFCVLQKGVGKSVFDPTQHKSSDRRTAITITISPLRAGQNETRRELIAESKEWAQTIKPSLTALNTDLRNINSKYVQATLVPNGTYEKKLPDGKSETRNKTTIQFVAVYANDVACQEAADVFFNSPRDDEAAPATSGASATERETALKFLPALWKASGGDVTKYASMLAANPLTQRYFDINSPEVVAAIAKG